MKKSKAVISIEFTLLFPLLLLLVLLMLDIGILFYSKAGTKNLIKNVLYNSYEEAYELKNSHFNRGENKALSFEEAIIHRLERSPLDDFYLNIDEAAFLGRMRERLNQAFGIDKSSINLSCNYDNIMGFSSMNLQYELKFRPLFYKLYNSVSPDFCSIKGEIKTEFTKHFDAISSVDCIERMAKKNQKIRDFLEKSRSMLQKLSLSIGGK